MKTKSQGHLLYHLAKNTSQTSLLAAWCQQDLEALTELVSALLSLAILAPSCLKGRAHLIVTEGSGSPLSAGQSQRPDRRPGDSSHHRNSATSLPSPLADDDQRVKRDPLNHSDLKGFTPA